MIIHVVYDPEPFLLGICKFEVDYHQKQKSDELIRREKLLDETELSFVI